MERRERDEGVRSGRASARALAVPMLVGALLAGCQASAARSCISWADLADDARVGPAEIVVDAAVTARAGERQMFGIQAAVWQVEVSAVLKGEVAVGTVLEVASTPPTCSGGTYPDGDPLDTSEPLRLYLRDTDFGIPATDTGLALITPFDGVGPVAAGGAGR